MTRCRVNNSDFKEPGTGFDPILGQVTNADGSRMRPIVTVLPDTDGNPDWWL